MALRSAVRVQPARGWPHELDLYGCTYSVTGVLRPVDVAPEHHEISRAMRAQGVEEALVLDDGEVLIESTAILDYLDEISGPSRGLIPDCGHVRREVLHICALATGLGDKAVSLLYERVLRGEESKRWVERCRSQIAGVLSGLEEDRARHKTRYWFGDNITHADIAVACVIRFTREAHAGLFDAARYPALNRHAETCEALQPFQDIVQPLAPPS